MSVQATSWAWERSAATGTTLLVLLAVADAANAQGESSCQSVATIARMVRASERTVQRALRDLEGSGELASTGTDPRYRTTLYALPGVVRDGYAAEARRTPPKGDTRPRLGVIQGDLGVTPGAAEGDTAMAPDPSNPRTTPQETQTGAETAPPPPARVAATLAYDGTGKALRFVVVQAIAKWALTNRETTPEAVADAMIRLHTSGKPVTQALVAQVLDGHLNLNGARSALAQRDRQAGGETWTAEGGGFWGATGGAQ